MTSPMNSGRTQHGFLTQDDPKNAAWRWFEVRQRYPLLLRPLSAAVVARVDARRPDARPMPSCVPGQDLSFLMSTVVRGAKPYQR